MLNEKSIKKMYDLFYIDLYAISFFFFLTLFFGIIG